MVGYLSLQADRWVAPLAQWDSTRSTYNTHNICDHPTWILRRSPQDYKHTQCKRYFALGYRHWLASTYHTPSPPKDKNTHSVSTPIAFSPRIYNITVEKFLLLVNSHVSPNGNLLCCLHLTLPGCRTRTSVVGAHCLYHLVTYNCCIIQRIRPNSSRPSKNFATCHWHPPTIW